MSSAPLPILSCYAVTLPGLERLTALELTGLGLTPGDSEPGGIGFASDLPGVMRANLELRTASRVLVRLGECRASSFHELERRSPRIPWEQVLIPGVTLRFRVTSRKSKLYHGGAVTERLLRAVAGRLSGVH